jgi:hypothetical protein
LKKILRTLVTTVWVNDQTKTARIDGVIPSTVDIMEISFESPLTRKWQHKQHRLPFRLMVKNQQQARA